jgi:hypothetical protein
MVRPETSSDRELEKTVSVQVRSEILRDRMVTDLAESPRSTPQRRHGPNLFTVYRATRQSKVGGNHIDRPHHGSSGSSRRI